jgi:hypothetical protein
VWEGIIVSPLAGEQGGLGALGLVKQAKGLYEQAIPMKVLQAPPRPGRQIADTGRREEARALMARLRSN